LIHPSSFLPQHAADLYGQTSPRAANVRIVLEAPSGIKQVKAVLRRHFN
jgi:hypothetical protein